MTSDSKTNKGSFSVDISDQAIEEALSAVQRLEKGASSEDESELSPSEESLIVEDLLVVEDDVEADDELDEVAFGGLDEGGESPEERSLESVEEENQLLRDKLVELSADMSNLRKRVQREKEEMERFAVENLLMELIPVLDNLDRAGAHAVQGGDTQSLAEGVEMVRRHFEETLERFGVRSFSALGQPFDPEFHEAVQVVESQEHSPNTVVEEMVRGYMLHERLVRPAMVCVSSKPDESRGDQDDGSAS